MPLLEDPLRNKGTGFTEAERSALGLRGLLPSAVETLEQQVARSYQEYQQQPGGRLHGQEFLSGAQTVYVNAWKLAGTRSSRYSGLGITA